MRGRPADLGESTGGGGGGETGRAHRRAGSTFATAWTLDGAQSLCPRDRQAANECRLRVPLIVFLSFVSSASEGEKDPLKPTGSVPRKRTGATLSPRGEAGAPNGFVQEKRQQRGRAAAGSREGMDRAPGLVAALAAWPGLAGASAPSCLGRETTGRAGLPEGAYWALCVLQKSPPSPPCRRRASAECYLLGLIWESVGSKLVAALCRSPNDCKSASAHVDLGGYRAILAPVRVTRVDRIFHFPTAVPLSPVSPLLCAVGANAPGPVACLVDSSSTGCWLGSASARPAGDWWAG